MVDRINKVLQKISKKDRASLLEILEQIRKGDVIKLDLKKLHGFEHTYRVRKGAYRIIFRMTDPTDIRVIAIERRSDTTYNGF